MTIPYEVGAMLAVQTATPIAAPTAASPRAVEAIPGIAPVGGAGADRTGRDPAALRHDRRKSDAVTSDASENEAANADAEPFAARTESSSRYSFAFRFLWGLDRPLMQIIDTVTEQAVSSYPPEHHARMLADSVSRREAESKEPRCVDKCA